MREQFRTFKFNRATLGLIAKANDIIGKLRKAGYILTLRQLYYRLVAADVIQNKQSEYKRLGSILNDARLAGMVDWEAIEDRTRNLCGVPHWDNPADIIKGCAAQFRIDKWRNQNNRIEVWVEKDALVGVIEKACRPLDVDWFSCRGYTSQSELYGAGKRLARYRKAGQTPVVIHLGDHDPSGKDMTRDIRERLEMFAEGRVLVRRIALNMEQIEEFSPPPNPAKATDSRFETYAAEFGEDCWELDALEPQYIDELIQGHVGEFRDEIQWEADQKEEDEHRANLANTSKFWEKVEKFVKKTANKK